MCFNTKGRLCINFAENQPVAFSLSTMETAVAKHLARINLPWELKILKNSTTMRRVP